MVIDPLIESLSAVEEAVRGLGREKLLDVLQPGVSAAQIRASLDEIGLRSNDEIEALYGWRNGSARSGATIGQISLWPGFYFTSLEGAVANYRAFVDDPRWTPGWLPVFADGGGDFYVVDLSRSDNAPVRHFRIDEAEHPIEFMSLGSMLATLEQAFRRGCFFVTPEGYLEMDSLAFADLAAEMNPDVEWWQS